MLLALLARDALSYGVMLVYAVLLGSAMAFLTPARDSLLTQVASGRVQRTVMLVSIVQFGMQIVGSLLAAFIDLAGPQPILVLQIVLLLAGVLALVALPVEDTASVRAEHPGSAIGALARGVLDGAKTVIGAPSLRVIVLQNIAMAVLFMGSFIVLFPLLVRETFGGEASDLSYVNAINSLGLVLMILWLLRLGDIQRQGRALIISQLLGSIALFAAACMPKLGAFVVFVFVWGLCGGVAMTMSRTIMQEQAPAAMRGRVMSFYGFSFMGAGPLGALVCGFLARWLGPGPAIMVAAASMFLIVLMVAAFSVLPRVVSTEAPLGDSTLAESNA